MDVVSGDVVTLAARGRGPGGGRPDQNLSPQQRVHQHGRGSLCPGAVGRGRAHRHGIRPVLPIAHLAPRLVGMDPIMWDPFRYKLGGRLLNGNFDEFMHQYGGQDSGAYTTVRDQASYAILKEVEAGRGSPHGGVYLDFRHVPDETLRAAFGPVIDRLADNGIDLTQTPVEVAPTAHYHMGGIRVDGRMETRVPGLYAAGEAVGGANGANRLSGKRHHRSVRVRGTRRPGSRGRGGRHHRRMERRGGCRRRGAPSKRPGRRRRERRTGQRAATEAPGRHVGARRTLPYRGRSRQGARRHP